MYYHDVDESDLKCLSSCVISECMAHNTRSVHAFQARIINLVIKPKFPHIKKLKYFSDRSGAQYKNCKNLLNLVHHYDDFGLHAEWHFFATSHGIAPCDGVGGTGKSTMGFNQICNIEC